MFTFFAILKKEARVLWNDRVGLIFMFLMPLLLVTVITIVQDSAFQLANNNRIKMVVVNHDEGAPSEQLIKLLSSSGMFGVIIKNELNQDQVAASIKDENALSALYIPKNFSQELEKKARNVSQKMLSDFGLMDTSESETKASPNVTLIFDPVLQENFTATITNILDAFLTQIESTLMIELLYQDMEMPNTPEDISGLITNNRVKITTLSANTQKAQVAANATQHNVPAWTIFAMFFMVISLGGNIVKEKVSGSFIRLRSMPVSVGLLFFAKMLLYLLVAILQVALLFSFASTVFTHLGLPLLQIPNNVPAFTAVVLVSGLTAVSYAMFIGALVKTQVQASGLGAISVIIFAALGGIWVPVFMMPDYLQKISSFSPLRQSLDAFYTLFLKSGNWADLWPSLLNLILFILVFQLGAWVKFKIDKII